MRQHDEPDIDPLYTALTRPVTVLGVPLEWFIIMLSQWGFCIIVWPAFFKALIVGSLLFAVGWTFGYIRTERDPHWMRILWVRFTRNPPTVNRHFWNADSYRP